MSNTTDTDLIMDEDFIAKLDKLILLVVVTYLPNLRQGYSVSDQILDFKLIGLKV